MQQRFERATAKTIWRMLDQPRCRASVDFLQLRAEVREVDSVRAQWWMDLANADDATRAEMIEAFQRGNNNTPDGTRRKPRRTSSEERRVGKECVITSRSRWSPAD